ncbi:MAG: hypothetical protein ACRC1T_09040 [Clostridium chrysemydis]|uniref:hypothetical protein n=1 Tax=Clostridium chrysemydis TaxID=2665504 RepID=UPI003F39A8A9
MKKKYFCRECNRMINLIEDIEDIISKYEDEGYIENEFKILMISENKFYFRDKIDNSVEIIEYFDKEKNMKDSIKMSECIDKAHEYNLSIKC